MPDFSTEQRDWTCPECGRVYRIPGWSEGPKRCPLCAPAASASPLSLFRRSWNLATALAEFAADGFKTVDAAWYEARLTVCDGCDRRSGMVCQECGCRIDLKARGRAWQCPLQRWPPADPS